MLTHVKKLTNPKNFDSRKNIFDPRNSRKNYDPRNMLTHVKNILIHVTHVTTQLTQFNWHISYKFKKFSEFGTWYTRLQVWSSLKVTSL